MQARAPNPFSRGSCYRATARLLSCLLVASSLWQYPLASLSPGIPRVPSMPERESDVKAPRFVDDYLPGYLLGCLAACLAAWLPACLACLHCHKYLIARLPSPLLRLRPRRCRLSHLAPATLPCRTLLEGLGGQPGFPGGKDLQNNTSQVSSSVR